jgi:hypothetical protein
MTLLLVLGSAAPVAIAFFLVASTNGGNPLDNIPDYAAPLTETLVIPVDRAGPTYTAFEYAGKVRLFIEGTGQAAGVGSSDAFYRYADADGLPLEIPQAGLFDLEIDGQRASDVLGLSGDPLLYNDDHLYAAIYDAGPRLRRLAFRVSEEAAGDYTGTLTITVVQLKE